MTEESTNPIAEAAGRGSVTTPGNGKPVSTAGGMVPVAPKPGRLPTVAASPMGPVKPPVVKED